LKEKERAHNHAQGVKKTPGPRCSAVFAGEFMDTSRREESKNTTPSNEQILERLKAEVSAWKKGRRQETPAPQQDNRNKPRGRRY
jgi:hypothetical protein